MLAVSPAVTMYRSAAFRASVDKVLAAAIAIFVPTVTKTAGISVLSVATVMSAVSVLTVAVVIGEGVGLYALDVTAVLIAVPALLMGQPTISSTQTLSFGSQHLLLALFYRPSDSSLLRSRYAAQDQALTSMMLLMLGMLR